MSSSRSKQQYRKNNTKYTPDSSEIRSIIDQYIVEKGTGSRDGSAISIPVGPEYIVDIQTYIMEKNPTWSVPEKRRLQKFVKRATSQKSMAPSTPTSQQSELTSESTNNEFDNRSERSRTSRLKGITNRLFGGGNSNSPRKQKSGLSQPPVYEIQTTMNTKVNTTEELLTDPMTDPGIVKGTEVSGTNQELGTASNVETSKPLPTMPQLQQHPQPVEQARAVDEIYSDDNDGKISKTGRCCFLWCC